MGLGANMAKPSDKKVTVIILNDLYKPMTHWHTDVVLTVTIKLSYHSNPPNLGKKAEQAG